MVEETGSPVMVLAAKNRAIFSHRSLATEKTVNQIGDGDKANYFITPKVEAALRKDAPLS